MKYLLAFILLCSTAFAAVTEVYVRPQDNDTNGDGSSGDPYGDLQHALDNTTHGGGGTRFNIMIGDGTAEILATALSTTTYISTNGATSATEPLIFQGCTTTAGDGGIGVIQGTTNSVAIYADTTNDNVAFVDLTLTSGNASGYALQGDDNFLVLRCTLTASDDGIDADVTTQVVNSTVSVSADAPNAVFSGSGQGALISSRIIQTAGIIGQAVSGIDTVHGNIFDITASGGSLPVVSGTRVCTNNTIFAVITGPSTFDFQAIEPAIQCVVANNYIEGFVGTNAEAINILSTAPNCVLANNKFYNNTANVVDAATHTNTIGGTTSLGSSGLTNAGSDDFTPTSDLIEAGWPASFWQLSGNANDPDVGAVQSAGGGGGVAFPVLQGPTQ